MSASDDLLAAISTQTGLPADQVSAVLATWQSVLDAAPAGTVVRHSDGKVAHRVVVEGVPLWRVTTDDGDQYNDMTPNLDWPVLYQPEGN